MDLSSELLYCRLAVVDGLEAASVKNRRRWLGLDDRLDRLITMNKSILVY